MNRTAIGYCQVCRLRGQMSAVGYVGKDKEVIYECDHCGTKWESGITRRDWLKQGDGEMSDKIKALDAERFFAEALANALNQTGPPTDRICRHLVEKATCPKCMPSRAQESLPDLMDSHCECLSATRDRDDCCATDLYSASAADHCGCCEKVTPLATKKPCVMDCHKLATKVRRAMEESERSGAYKLFLAVRERSQSICHRCESKISSYMVAEEFDRLFPAKD